MCIHNKKTRLCVLGESPAKKDLGILLLELPPEVITQQPLADTVQGQAGCFPRLQEHVVVCQAMALNEVAPVHTLVESLQRNFSVAIALRPFPQAKSIHGAGQPLIKCQLEANFGRFPCNSKERVRRLTRTPKLLWALLHVPTDLVLVEAEGCSIASRPVVAWQLRAQEEGHTSDLEIDGFIFHQLHGPVEPTVLNPTPGRREVKQHADLGNPSLFAGLLVLGPVTLLTLSRAIPCSFASPTPHHQALTHATAEARAAPCGP
mmetsp:Transcript_78689/g.182562  ORF Transcript_78689/g.182562 Transcript_78689/m.182562 type:complete len:262 (-) Transcript_78689:494-1279(-)